MSYAVPADEPGGVAPAALSLLVHFILLAMLVFGLGWQSKHPDAVEVELWSQLPVVEPPPRIEPKPAPKAEVKPPPEPKVEQKAAKPDIAIEREKKAKKKKEPPLKFDNTSRIREQLAQEQKALQTRERQDVLKQFTQPAAPSIDASYADKIRTRIKMNLVVPSDIRGNPEAIFDVTQLPTGEVLSVRLVTSSGYEPYDKAVERAILKSSPLPRPDRPEQFRRELELKFRPQE
ncbi:MAG TPA: TonB C-terminal domain-containing protein [Burkholderiales bacterium]|nr:TonB C-terminal domain-containing protein [Burkholderiales bacterium]